MLEQFQPWIDYKKLIEEQANEVNSTIARQPEKPKVKTKGYQQKTVQHLKIGKK